MQRASDLLPLGVNGPIVAAFDRVSDVDYEIGTSCLGFSQSLFVNTRLGLTGAIS